MTTNWAMGEVPMSMTKPHERLSETLARRLRGLLAERRISGSELARMTGLSQSKVSRRLTGEYPFDLDELDVICGVLGLSLSDLLPGGRRRPHPDGPDGGVDVDLVRHQGLEPRTRWFGVGRAAAGGVVVPLPRREDRPATPLTNPDRRAA